MDQIRVNGIEEAERVLDEMIRNYPKQTVAAGYVPLQNLL